MDSYLKEDGPGDRKGDDSELRVKTETGKRNHALVQFDLSSLPVDMTPVSAEMALWVKDSSGIAAVVAAHVVQSSWNETEVTWEHRDKAASLPWTTAGGDYKPTVADSVVVNQKDVWVSWDLMDEVAMWMAAPVGNFGVLLEAGVTDPKAEKKFLSSDDGNAETHPKLTVCYDQPLPPPPLCYVLQPGSEGADAYLKEDGPGDRKGNDSELRVKTEAGKRNHALLQFDLSSLPTDLTMLSADLSLWVKDNGGAPVSVAAHVVQNSWNEAEVTWAHRDKAASLPWTTGGGDYLPVVADSTLVNQKDVWASWDLMDEVATWMAAPAGNFGVLLEAGVTDPKAEKKFVSSDDGDEEQRPVLTVCYDPPPPPPPICYALQPGEEGMDSYLKEDGPGDREGDDDELRVKTEAGKRNHSLLQFDLSSLPTSLALVSADLSLWVKDNGGAPVSVAAHAVQTSWNEAEVTWAHRDKAAGLPWAAAGGDYSPAVADSTLVNQKDVWASWDLMDALATWMAAPAGNFGVLLEAGVTDPKAEKKFVSSDDGDEEQRPTLNVCFAYSGSEP